VLSWGVSALWRPIFPGTHSFLVLVWYLLQGISVPMETMGCSIKALGLIGVLHLGTHLETGFKEVL